MTEDLATIADRIESANKAIAAVERVHSGNAYQTFVDFETTGMGIGWSGADLDGWVPTAAEKTGDTEYRVWFEAE